MIRGFGALALLAAVACSSKSEVKGGGVPSDPSSVAAKPTLTVFALAEVRGQVGPCGCTSDPLGDISRTTRLVADARAKGPVLFVDAGSLLYAKDPIPPAMDAQEELKADLLASVYKDHIDVGALGLGPADMVKGPEKLRLPRTVANLGGVIASPGSAGARSTPKGSAESIDMKGLQTSGVMTVGTAKVGVFGVIAQGAVKGLEVTDPVAAGKQAVADLKKQGAQLVIALVQASSKRDAVAIVRDIGGVDLTIAGLGAVAPEPDRISVEADKVGDGWLVVPANRGQILSRIDITLRGAGPLADAVGAGAATVKIAQLDGQVKALDAELAKFKADTTADPAFVKQKQAEREQLAAQKQRLEVQPLAAPKTGSYFTLEQIRINKKLACSAPVRDMIKTYDKSVGEANLKFAAGKLPLPAPKGKPSYVGNEVCGDCHGDELEVWNKTRHAGAWKTLTDRNQEYNLECTGCHVTGWDQPGGTNLAKLEGFVNVGCETCHGPGSIHAAKGGDEKPLAIVKRPKEDLCATQCHTKEHSDTFEYTAYMRDIVGPNHGEAYRTSLGDGPTGHQLRSAALDKAGRELGEGCVK